MVVIINVVPANKLSAIVQNISLTEIYKSNYRADGWQYSFNLNSFCDQLHKRGM